MNRPTANSQDQRGTVREQGDPSGIRTRVPPAPNSPPILGISPDLNTRSAPSPIPLPSDPIAVRCARKFRESIGRSLVNCTLPSGHPEPCHWSTGEIARWEGWKFTEPTDRACARCGAAPGTSCDPAKHDGRRDVDDIRDRQNRAALNCGPNAADTALGRNVRDALAHPPPRPRDAIFSSELQQAHFNAHVEGCDRCHEALDAAALCPTGARIWAAVTAAPPPTPVERGSGPVVRVVVVPSTQVRGALSLRSHDGGGFSALAAALDAAGFRPGDVLELRRAP